MTQKTPTQFQLWAHYTVVHGYISPWLPPPARTHVYEASRRWLYGPNANNEDLRELLDRACHRIQDR